MFFIELNSGQVFDANLSMFKLYFEKMPMLDLDEDAEYLEREPGRTDFEHLQLWVDYWNNRENIASTDGTKWDVVDSYTPMFDWSQL